MNLKTLFCGFAAAAMLTACSSDEPAVGPNGPDNGQFNGSGYMNVAINMPTSNGSRAENDNFDHGTANEYKVDNAMLILFTGATEDAAVFHSAYDLDDMTKSADGAAGVNITKTYTKTIQVNNVSDGAVLWGLVLVNYDQVATKVLDGNAGFIKTLTFNGKPVTAGTTKFTEMNTEISAQDLKKATDHFFMANAPINANLGGAMTPSDEVTTLVKLGTPAQCIRPTAAEAEAQPAGSFYVERAVAKATLTYASVTDETIEANGLTIESVEWVIDNVEPTSYVIRNMGDKSYIPLFSAVNGVNANKHRFVGHSAIGETSLQPTRPIYRTYWCIDPAYNTDKTDNRATDATALTFLPAGHTNPQYCHENTFDVARQSYKNTTRAILKVKFASSATGADGNLYVVANDPSKVYDKEADAKSLMISAIIDQAKVDLSAADVLTPGKSINISTDNYADYLEVTWAAADASNVIRVASVSYKDNEAYANKPAPFTEATINNLNAYWRYTKYNEGVAYYDVRFKHFGDDLTPWIAPGSSVDTPDTAYGTDAAATSNYLGRYGMVRNNWYELNITSFKNLGKPVVNDLNVEKSDDNNEAEKWISFKINILAWALRLQNVDL